MDDETEDVKKWEPPPLDVRYLELQNPFFKTTMILNAQVAMSLTYSWPRTGCPIFGASFLSNTFISTKHLEFMKVAKIAHVQVLGSVENKRIFNSLLFLKNKWRKWLTTHLDLVVHMFAPWTP